jgi:hypothetical protein
VGKPPPIVFKAVTTLAASAFKAAKQQWKLRGASLSTYPGLNVERELDSALSVLIGDWQTALEATATWLKGKLSDRSDLFIDEPVREWLRQPDVQRIIKDATIAFIQGDSIDELRSSAEATYQKSSGDFDWYGGALFDLAVAYLAFSLDTKITTGERLLSQQIGAVTSTVVDEIAAAAQAQRDDMALVLQKIEQSREFPTQAVQEFLENFIRRENRIRAVVDPDRIERILSVATKAREGELRAAALDLRIEVFRLAAQTLARVNRTEDADAWLDLAKDCGAKDLANDCARVELYRSNWEAVFSLLENASDAVAMGIKIDALDRRDGREAALRYFDKYIKTAEITGFLLTTIAGWLADAGHWDRALEILEGATDSQIDENPTVLFQRARTRLALMVPAGQRTGMYENSAAFPQPTQLRDDKAGRELATAAARDLERLSSLIAELRIPEFGKTVEVNQLYLELASNDEALVERAKAKLTALLNDPKELLQYAWIALLFEVPFDRSAFQTQLDQARALGPWSDTQLFAATQLVLQDENPDEVLAFIREHEDQLQRLMPPEITFGAQIEILARKGDVAAARDILDAQRAKLSEHTVSRLEAIIGEESGRDSLALRMETFEKSTAETDLFFLVRELVRRHDVRAGEYAAMLWRARHKMEDAVLACDWMFNHGQDRELEAFLAELGELVLQHPKLEEHSAWATYRLGELKKAQKIVNRLRTDQPDSASLRQLQINIALEAGDWHRLGPLLRDDLERSTHRSARQLLQAAGLAHAADNPIADELLRAAVAKAPDDPQVLVTAYNMAVRRGRDWEAEASDWLRRAIDKSGEDGPLQKKDLKDFVQLRNDSLERSQKLDQMIMSGEIPVGMAVRPLGTTLSDLVLGRLAENVQTRDARRRLCLPLIAGNRLHGDLTGLGRVALDPSAIWLLQLAGLLKETLEVFPKIVLPSGTLPLLFRELERAESTQPSRVHQAIRLKALFDAGRVEQFAIDDDADEIDSLYAKAEELDGYLVHGTPMFEPTSLLEQIRDHTKYAQRLISPVTVARSLHAVGELSAEEFERAKSRLLSLGEEREGVIELDRPLILDGTVLHAFDDAGILEPLLATGAQLIAEKRVSQIAELEIRQQETARQLHRSIEQVRAALTSALDHDRAEIGPFRRAGPEDDEEIEGVKDVELAPLLSLLRDISSVDALISADRVINRYGQAVDQHHKSRPVFTPIDVIDHLRDTNAITAERHASAIRKLRLAGVAFIPVDGREIADAALEGDWTKQVPRSIRAICQSVHLPLVRGAAVLPETRYWLGQVAMQFARAIKLIWTDAPSVEQAATAASHLFQNIPFILGHASRDESGDATSWAVTVTAGVHVMLALPLEVPLDRLEAYHEWYDEVVPLRLFGREREAQPEVVDRLRAIVLTQGDIADDNTHEVIVAADYAARLVVVRIPSLLRDQVLDEAAVRAKLSDVADAISLAGHTVSNATFGEFLRDIFAGKKASLADVTGEEITSSAELNDDGTVSIVVGSDRLRINEGALYADDPNVRRRILDQTLRAHSIAFSSAVRWRAVVDHEPLTPGLFMALMDSIRATPQSFISGVRESADNLTFEMLTRTDPLYFRNLLDLPGEGTTLDEVVRRLEQDAIAEGPLITRLVTMGPMTIYPGFSAARVSSELSGSDALTLATDLAEAGDPCSLIAAFEICCSRVSDTAFKSLGDTILNAWLGSEGRFGSSCHDFAAAALLEFVALERQNTLVDLPLGLRRFSALVHAGYATRALSQFEIVRPELFEKVRAWGGYRLQMGGFIERAESAFWLRDWLIPESIHGLALQRLSAVLQSIPEEERPKDWEEQISEELKRQAESALIGLFLPGPLDEFLPDYASSEFEPGDQLRQLDDAPPDQLVRLIYPLSLGFAAPEDKADAIDKLSRALERTPAQSRPLVVDALLAIAARWRLPDLADRVIDHLNSNKDLDLTVAARSLLAIGSAVADEDSAAQVDRLKLSFERLGFSNLPPDDLVELAQEIEMLSNMAPRWATSLERARSAALLGS